MQERGEGERLGMKLRKKYTSGVLEQTDTISGSSN